MAAPIARAVRGRHGIVYHPAGLVDPFAPEQGVGEAAEGVGVLAAVGVDPGEFDNPLDLAQGHGLRLAEVEGVSRHAAPESARPERVALGGTRSRAGGTAGCCRGTRPHPSARLPCAFEQPRVTDHIPGVGTHLPQLGGPGQ